MIGSTAIARRLRLAFAGLLVAACSVAPPISSDSSIEPSPSSTASTTVAVATGTLTQTAQPTDALMSALPPGATLEPSASRSPQPRQMLSPEQLPHADADLEALLPTRIGDVLLFRMSALGRDFSGGGDMCSFVCPMEPKLMADRVGATVEDIRLAVAVDPEVQQYLLVAWHVDGATGAELRDARIATHG